MTWPSCLCVHRPGSPAFWREKDWAMSPGGSLICSVSDPPPFYLCLSYVEHFMWALMMVLMVVSPSTNIEGSYICRALLCSCFFKARAFFFLLLFFYLFLSPPPVSFGFRLFFCFYSSVFRPLVLSFSLFLLAPAGGSHQKKKKKKKKK